MAFGWNPLISRGDAQLARTVNSLRSEARHWRRGVITTGVMPLTLGIAGLLCLGAYGADLLAREHVASMELIPGLLTLRPIEHVVMIPFLVTLLIYVLVAVLLLGVTPVMSSRLEWWTRRRWALIVSIAVLSAGVLSNFVELLQRGSVTDFLLIHNLGDFSAGDFLSVIGVAATFVFLVPPDYIAVRNRHVLFAIGAFVVSLIALPLIRPPLSHVFPLGVLLASLVWLGSYLLWRVSVGNRVLETLASDVPHDSGPQTGRVLEDLEAVLQNSTHTDLAASARALAKLADAYWRLRRPEDLRRTSDTYLRVAEEVNNDRMKAWALDCLGFVYCLEDDPAQASRAWQESLRLANQQRDDRHKLLLLANIGWAEVELDRTDDAQRTYASALDLAERLGNTEMTSRLRHALSLVRPSAS